MPTQGNTAVCTALVAAAALLLSACRSESTPPAQEVVVWRLVGSWSGHGNAQTESFDGETGSLRVHWETRNEAPAGAGTFRLTIHSAISGRPLSLAVDHRGVGRDTAYVREDPRVFYAVVDSVHLDWSFTIEEALVGTVTETKAADAVGSPGAADALSVSQDDR